MPILHHVHTLVGRMLDIDGLEISFRDGAGVRISRDFHSAYMEEVKHALKSLFKDKMWPAAPYPLTTARPGYKATAEKPFWSVLDEELEEAQAFHDKGLDPMKNTLGVSNRPARTRGAVDAGAP